MPIRAGLSCDASGSRVDGAVKPLGSVDGEVKITTAPRDDFAALTSEPQKRRIVLFILAVALVARVPGVFWGANFPMDGWTEHHIDEFTHVALANTMIDPSSGPETDPPKYPKGTAAMIAIPFKAYRIATGRQNAPLPEVRSLIVPGRWISVVYGVATVLLSMLFAHRLWASWPVAATAGGITALGGLHVSQSHFFLADVPSLFWLVLGLYLLFIDLEERPARGIDYFHWSAFAFGVAFGLKLLVFGLPSLAIATLLPGQRVRRIAGAIIFFIAGAAGINALSFTPLGLIETIRRANVPFQYSKCSAALLYLVQLPSVFSLPVTTLSVLGAVLLARGAITARNPERLRTIGLTIVLPLVVIVYSLIFKLNPFPRHLLLLLPWVALAAARGLCYLSDPIAARHVPR